MSKDGAKNYLKSKERFVQLKSGDYIDNEQLSEIIRESLEKIDFYKKYSYGLDDVPNKTKAHDDIIGHT
jgi:phenylacetate-coenzyme A ligase PaaK-like adenylate-forming protein